MGKATDQVRWRGQWWDWALLTVVTAAVLIGSGLRLAGQPDDANIAWIVATGFGLAVAVAWVATSLMRRRVGVDVVAVLAMAAALGAGQYLAGAVVAVMLIAGAALEAYALAMASRNLHALVERVPRVARRFDVRGSVEVIDPDVVCPDDRLLVEPGEVVAVDGFAEESVLLDESAVTGEFEPVERGPGEPVASGVVNAGAAFSMRATATAAHSTYTGIVRLAREAVRQRAPIIRLADRYALALLGLTLLVAGLSWLITGDLVRAVAVLVVATPGPLILAAPIAVISGLSRVAQMGIVVRDGGSLENLGRAGTLMVEKSGTLTQGRPRATEVVCPPGVEPDDVLRLAASIEQLSAHVLAGAVVDEAARHGLPLSVPDEVHEEPGQGVGGRVDGRDVWVGRLRGKPTPWVEQERQRAELAGAAVVWVDLDEKTSGALLVEDPVRPDARRTARRLREAGLSRLVMMTGDRRRVADEVARVVGVDDVLAQCGPEEKAERVREERQSAVTVMVGDGVYDGAALGAANVGVAVGATGADARAGVTDAVLTVDRLDRLADAVEIARHARLVAVQSAMAGTVLVLAGISVAAAGLLTPVAGALIREGIEIVVIFSAMRALIGGVHRRQLPAGADELVDQFATEHEKLRETLARVRTTADLVATEHDGSMCVDALRDAHSRLSRQLLSHDEAEEQRLYPALAGPLGGAEATATMSRAHTEIRRLVERVDGHLCQASDSRLDVEQVPDLLATLYGLDAILRLHFAEEEEQLFSLTTAGNPVAVGQ